MALLSGSGSGSEPEPVANPPILDTVAEEHPRLARELEQVWTVICRGWESDFFDLTGDEIDAMLGVYVSPGDYLTGHECQDLELFTEDLGKLRAADRGYANLTALEHSILRILRRGARRKLDAESESEPEPEPSANQEVTR